MFKVGDKGKTNRGVTYEILAEAYLDGQPSFVVKFTRGRSDCLGRTNLLGSTAHGDKLLPKTRKVTLYLNLHKSGSVFASDDEKWMREHGNQLCTIIAHPIEVEIPDVTEE